MTIQEIVERYPLSYPFKWVGPVTYVSVYSENTRDHELIWRGRDVDKARQNYGSIVRGIGTEVVATADTLEEAAQIMHNLVLLGEA